MVKIYNRHLAVLLIVLLFTGYNGYSQNIKPKSVPDKQKYEYQLQNDQKESGYFEYVPKSAAERISRKETKNYFRIDRSGNSLWNGKHWLPDKFPLKVHIKECTSDKYKALFKSFVEYAFKVWQQADSRIGYRFIRTAEEADIVIIFEENLMDKYEENFLGLTDYELGLNREIKVSTVEIGLLKHKNELLSEGEIKATIIHEIGHAFGLGHSSNASDLMYPYIDPDFSSEMNYDELSTGDREAIISMIDLCYYMKYSMN